MIFHRHCPMECAYMQNNRTLIRPISPNPTYLRADVDTAPGATAAGAKAAADPARRAPRARVNFMVN